MARRNARQKITITEIKKIYEEQGVVAAADALGNRNFVVRTDAEAIEAIVVGAKMERELVSR